jgi:hypothetical protein
MTIKKIQVHSDSGHTYELTLEEGKVIWCTCPAYKFAKGPSKVRSCKHQKAVEASDIPLPR